MSILPRTLGLLALATVLVPGPTVAQDDDGWRRFESCRACFFLTR